MGSLTKRPKIPKQVPPTPTVQYVPAPEVTALEDSSATDKDVETSARKESLLRRSRGRLGTVFTGFRGLLSPADASGNQGTKTLLGE